MVFEKRGISKSKPLTQFITPFHYSYLCILVIEGSYDYELNHPTDLPIATIYPNLNKLYNTYANMYVMAFPINPLWQGRRTIWLSGDIVGRMNTF